MDIFRRLAHHAVAVARASRFTDTHVPLTSSRLLGQRECRQVLSRHSRGWNDVYGIVGLEITPGSRLITNEDVMHAWAAVRLHHPTLASRISFATSLPEFVCSSPVSEAHAVEQANATIRFGTFENRDAEVKSVLDRCLSIDPRHVLDITSSTSAIQWSTGVGEARGQYVLGLQAPHCTTDGFGLLNVLRQFLELLSQDGEAESTLVRRFSFPVLPPRLPACVEDQIQDLSRCSTADLEAGRQVYAEMMKGSHLDKTGLVADGAHDPDRAAFRVATHIWSPPETVQIIRGCRAQGVTVTQLSMAAMALASVQPGDGSSSSSSQSQPAPSHGQPHVFAINSAVDLSRRLLPSTNPHEMETTTRAGVYPLLLQTSRSLHSAEEQRAALWEMAEQCRTQTAAVLTSPHFWQLLDYAQAFTIQCYLDGLAGKPVLPFMSSMGDVTQAFPPRYAITGSGFDPVAVGGRPTGRRGGELGVASLCFGGKVFPSFHLWTYGGRLHLQLTYDSSQFSDALIGLYFRRIAELIGQAGVERKLWQDRCGMETTGLSSPALGRAGSL